MEIDSLRLKSRLATGMCAVVMVFIGYGAVHAGSFPTVPLKDLPDPLRSVW
jgi:hypothetical protein